ncbi:TRAP-type C4-dicarboxylate transport system, small permease component [Rheinheimera pacifica]|uniref:TRAP transporter small permease protein n=1 Tax=Rheinheimera pacifica TaxID=173990 RepID=A0A1H6MR41_9GAMM|nr:TRAP transporter small permease [Rheinheimera pacifica]SEI01907.1 TRAP-type C4-dicarboxylate transport system, small permease component [Rheinheimera pacifica]
MTKLIQVVDSLLKWFLAGLMGGIVLVVCWQVVSRYILNAPSSITEELSRTFLIWIGMVGAAFAYRTGVHLGLDIVTQKFPPAIQRRLALVLTASVVIFAIAVMVIGGGNLVALTWELNQMSAALGIKMAYIYIAVPLSGVLIAFYGICQLYFMACNKPTPAVEGMH